MVFIARDQRWAFEQNNNTAQETRMKHMVEMESSLNTGRMQIRSDSSSRSRFAECAARVQDDWTCARKDLAAVRRSRRADSPYRHQLLMAFDTSLLDWRGVRALEMDSSNRLLAIASICQRIAQVASMRLMHASRTRLSGKNGWAAVYT
jgi:hypothetical protein